MRIFQCHVLQLSRTDFSAADGKLSTAAMRAVAFALLLGAAMPLAAQINVTLPGSSTRTFSCTFSSSPADCGFFEESKVAGRATILSSGRDGGRAVRLHSEPGDSNVSGSGVNERDDISLS